MLTQKKNSLRFNRTSSALCTFTALTLAVCVGSGLGFSHGVSYGLPLGNPQNIMASQKTKPKTPAKSTPATIKPSHADTTKPLPKPSDAEISASIAAAMPVSPIVLLQNPSGYLNRKVTFSGTFNRFADIALDYKKAFRDSRDYVTFFILRPDVKNATIPMSELKLFFPRKKSAEAMDLESGDQIQIVGTEFSTALDEPWVDVEHIKVLQKTDHPDRKHEMSEF